MNRLFITFTLTAVSTIALAAPKTAPDLPQSSPNSAIDVIVSFRNPPTKGELKQLGPYGQIKKIFSQVNAAQVSLTPAQIQSLVASDSNIVYISPDRPTQRTL